MTISSRRSRRTTRLGKRAALSLPVALLALTIMAPGYADGDAGGDAGGGDAAVSSEAQAEKPDPKPEPEVQADPEPKPEPKPEEPKPAPEQKPEEPKPAPEPKSDSKPEPKDNAPAGDGAEDSAEQVKQPAAAAAEDKPEDKADKDDKADKPENLKVVVCKYTGTPPGSPSHIIVVADNAVQGWDGVTFANRFFSDGQESVVVRYAEDKEQANEIALSTCEGFAPGDPEPELIDPPDLDTNDPCGPGNIAFEELADTDEFTVAVLGNGNVVLTAKEGYEFEGGESTFTYVLPADSNVLCTGPGDGDEKKVVVCKYVGAPPGTPDHIIVVSVATLLNQGWDGETFPFTFPDAQDSIAIRFAVGNEQPGNEELRFCPGGEEEITPPTLEPNDPCGPDNIAFPEVPATDQYTVGVTGDGDVTLIAKPGYVFPGGESSLTFVLPDDSNEPCPVERQLVACVYADDAGGDEIGLARAALGAVVLVDEVDAFAAGFTGTLPYEYMDGSNIVELRQYLQPGETLADFDAEELCGEVGGIICDEVGATADTADDCGEVGGIVEDSPAATPVADVLPNTGGPLALLAPLGALMVLVGAGLVMVRRPHSA